MKRDLFFTERKHIKHVKYNIVSMITLLCNMGGKEIIANSDEDQTGGLMCLIFLLWGR